VAKPLRVKSHLAGMTNPKTFLIREETDKNPQNQRKNKNQRPLRNQVHMQARIHRAQYSSDPIPFRFKN
jgi:hypothetical protein